MEMAVPFYSVFTPADFILQKRSICAKGNKDFFRICVLEIPLRMLGAYNSRLARYPQIAQIVLIPLVLAKVGNRQTKMALYVYYIMWYTFYFAYLGYVFPTMLPYVWVIS